MMIVGVQIANDGKFSVNFKYCDKVAAFVVIQVIQYHGLSFHNESVIFNYRLKCSIIKNAILTLSEL